MEQDGAVGQSYFEHDADIGVIGRGATLERAFEDAARAMFAIMTDPDQVRSLQSLTVDFIESDRELALASWLNRLLGEARSRGLALGRFRLHRDGERWSGEAVGEPWRAELERGVEVKGATLTMLSVRPVDGGWEARCVVDV